MHDLLLDNQDALGLNDLVGYAGQTRPRRRALPGRRAHSTRSPPASPRTSTAPTSSGVSGTPTFFINGRRHYGAYDIGTLSAAVRVAAAQAALANGITG